MATITYKGVTHRPNNATSPDGELALCLNLVNDNGTLTPLEQPTHIGSLPSNMQALFIHQSATYHHIIIYYFTNNSVIWADYAHLNDIDWGEEKHWGYIIKGTREMPSVTALGNTLILTFKNQPLQYAVWKNEGYTPLGSHPPFIPIQFVKEYRAVDTSLIPSTSSFFSFDGLEYPDYSVINPEPITESLEDGTLKPFDKFKNESYQQYLTEPVFAQLNKYISSICYENDESYFIFPFFVRYAIRLYDGTLTQHSFPVLITPNSKIIAELKGLTVYKYNQKVTIKGAGVFNSFASKLRYRILDVPEQFSDWEDLIQGIDVYISAPIYTHEQNGYIKGWTTPESSYIPNNIYDTQYDYQLLLPFKEDNILNKEIEETSLFYKIYTINTNEVIKTNLDIAGKQTSLAIKIKSNIFSAITSQEVMPDDFNSHRDKIAHSLTIYNSRLNLGGVDEKITNQVPINTQVPDTYLNPTNQTTPVAYSSIAITTQITENSETHYLYQNYGECLEFPRYLFFNTSNATQLYVKFNNINYKIILKEHPGLNGAVYFRGFGDNMPERVNTIPTGENSITIHYPNKLYTSNVDNPFTFRPENINTIGSGNIRALSAATQAISQGQFGAFPLYAFTDEGIWALAVSGTGGWTSIQPVTRDVITEGTIPLSLDNAIAFFSAKGLMLLQGGDVSCMSAMLDTNTPSSVLDNIVTYLSDDFIAAVKRFPKSAALAYDYAHSRIYALAPNAHWIYSTKLGTWSHAEGGNLGDYALNNYPNTIIVRCDKNKGQHLYSLNDNCEYYNYAEFITRPLHFGTHSLRTIRALVTRGLISNEDEISVYLYASMDNNSFIPIAANGLSANIHRISGSAYRSHCLHVIAPHLTPSFAINSTEFDVVTKHSHKLR